MNRLQAAVNKAPKALGMRAPNASQLPQAERQPRFGINSLINRMTGHTSEPAQRQDRQPVPPQVTPITESESDPEQERIDIPAFLRRQAN